MAASAPAASSGRAAAIAGGACLAAALMFGFGYAMVPLYYKLCAALGITTARDYVRPATEWSAEDAGRELRAEFDANAHSSRLAMVPSQRVSAMHTGVAYSITYELRNLTDEPLRGRAVPSYSPARAAQWVTKLQCFCFDEIELGPGEVMRAPVVLTFADEMPADIGVVALSYTFFDHGDPGAGGHGDDHHR